MPAPSADPVQAAPFPTGAILRYLCGRLLWMGAYQMSNMALGWLIYDATRSALALGFAGLAAFLPKLALVLVSGLVADRFDRRRVLAACMMVHALATVGLCLIALSDRPSIALAYGLVVLLGTSQGFAAPSAQALMASLAPRAHFSRVVSMGSSTMQIASISGPAIGGLFYLLGAEVPFIVATGCFLAAAVLILSLPRPQPRMAQLRPGLGTALEGIRYIRQRPVILGAMSLDMFSVLLGGMTALLPIIVSELLHGGPEMLGLLRSMPAVGAMTLGILLAWRPIQRRAGTVLFIATSIFGLATIGVGLSANVMTTLALLWLSGAADVVSVVIRQTLVQAETPDEMRGRVSAVNTVFIGASNQLGEFESGVTAAAFGLVPAILIGGIGTLCVVAAWSVLFPDLRRRDQLIES